MVEVRTNRRARRLVVRVLPHGVVAVSAPTYATWEEICGALRRHRAWIAARLAEEEQRAALLPGADGTLPYLGRRLRVVTEEGRSRPRLLLGAGLLLVGPGNQRPAVERLYRRRARLEVNRLLAPLVARSGLAPQQVRIAGQRSRWGSCSSSGCLSFNWQLLLAPEPILRYVVAHELAHLAVPNHSPAFWEVVGRLDPSFGSARRWLAAEGWRLRLADPLVGSSNQPRSSIGT